MGSEFTNGHRESFTRVNGTTTRRTAEVILSGSMALVNTKVNSKTMNVMDKASISGRTELSLIAVCGAMV